MVEWGVPPLREEEQREGLDHLIDAAADRPRAELIVTCTPPDFAAVGAEAHARDLCSRQRWSRCDELAPGRSQMHSDYGTQASRPRAGQFAAPLAAPRAASIVDVRGGAARPGPRLYLSPAARSGRSRGRGCSPGRRGSDRRLRWVICRSLYRGRGERRHSQPGAVAGPGLPIVSTRYARAQRRRE